MTGDERIEAAPRVRFRLSKESYQFCHVERQYIRRVSATWETVDMVNVDAIRGLLERGVAERVSNGEVVEIAVVERT